MIIKMNEIVNRLRRLSKSLKENRLVDGLDQFDKDIDEIEKVFDKATPKKILTSVKDNGEPFLPRGYGECSKCKTVVGCNNKYCRECGQRLEW